MPIINTAIQLANVRSKIDAQQQIVSMLEVELQKAILGDDTSTIGSVVGEFGVEDPLHPTLGSILAGISGPGGSMDPTSYGDGLDLYNAYLNPLVLHFNATSDTPGDDVLANEQLDQDVIRQMLYQARALLGELRVEEQHWNGEVNEEKARRKDLGEFAKG